MRRHWADDVALIRYASGSNFKPERVRRAYLNCIESWRREIEEASAAGLAAFNARNQTDPEAVDIPQPASGEEIAEWGEPILARRMIEHPRSGDLRRLLREAGQQPRAAIEAAAGEFATTFLGASQERGSSDGMLSVLGWGGQETAPELHHAARSSYADLAAIGSFASIEAAIRAATPDRFYRAREVFRCYRRLRDDGPLFDALEAPAAVRGAFTTATARTQSFSGDLSDASEILGFLLMMEYNLLPGLPV